MLARIALRNVRRSVGDYAVYFVTIVLGVAVFYAFNSISSQRLVFEMRASGTTLLEQVDGLMAYFSVVVAFVLGFLVVYANRFLIRRRRQEFGTYLLLGMRPGQVSLVVLGETLVVGVASLVVGLLAGLVLSQLLSLATAAMFEVPMDTYRFVFSPHALLTTLQCFVVIFAVTALLNTLEVRRTALVELISPRGRNERYRTPRPWLSLGVFVASVVVLALDYRALHEHALYLFDDEFLHITLVMLASTFALFWSLGGFVLFAVRRARPVYLRGLAMFTVRQVASRVNTAFVSLWAVCVLLFLSITTFSTGFALVDLLSGQAAGATPYDATLDASLSSSALDEMPAAEGDRIRGMLEECDWDTASWLSERSETWGKVVGGTAQVDLWEADLGLADVAEACGYDLEGSELSGMVSPDARLVLVSVSQYNAACRLCGEDGIELADDEYAVDNTFPTSGELAGRVAAEGRSLTLAGITLSSSGLLEGQALADSSYSSETCVLVVPDRVVDAIRATGALPASSHLDVEYAAGVSAEDGGRLLEQALSEAMPVAEGSPEEELGWSYGTDAWPVTTYDTAYRLRAKAIGARMLITYLAVYIGFVLLVATAAILAIQQLSDASDSVGRYRVLAELGCDRRMVLGSLRAQVLLYFLAPLAVAVCHSACAIDVVQRELLLGYDVSVGPTIGLAAASVVAIYGTYMLVTYYGCCRLVRSGLGRKLLG